MLSSIKQTEKSFAIGVSNNKDLIYLDPESQIKNRISLPNCEILPPKTRNIEREIVVCYGCSGAGKSHIVKKYTKYYHRLYPDNDIFLISKLSGDKTFEDIEDIVTRIPLDISLLLDIANGIAIHDENDPERISDCLFILDDIDAINNKDVATALNSLITALLELGRHGNISGILTAHLPIGGRDLARARTMMNESSRCVIFPSAGSQHLLKRLLTTYIGFDNLQVFEIMNLKSRWVCIHKSRPQYILHEKGAYIV